MASDGCWALWHGEGVHSVSDAVVLWCRDCDVSVLHVADPSGSCHLTLLQGCLHQHLVQSESFTLGWKGCPLEVYREGTALGRIGQGKAALVGKEGRAGPLVVSRVRKEGLVPTCDLWNNDVECDCCMDLP
jgi:hypothetical protein